MRVRRARRRCRIPIDIFSANGVPAAIGLTIDAERCGKSRVQEPGSESDEEVIGQRPAEQRVAVLAYMERETLDRACEAADCGVDRYRSGPICVRAVVARCVLSAIPGVRTHGQIQQRATDYLDLPPE